MAVEKETGRYERFLPSAIRSTALLIRLALVSDFLALSVQSTYSFLRVLRKDLKNLCFCIVFLRTLKVFRNIVE